MKKIKSTTGTEMKKTILVSMLIGGASLFASNVDDIQQKTNYILIKKIKTLQEKVNTLEANQIKSNLDIEKIKKQLLMGDNAMLFVDKRLNKSNTKEEKIVKPSKKHAAKTITYDFKNIYRVKKECQGYANAHGEKTISKIFKRDSFVMIMKKGKTRSMTHTGVWMNNDCFRKITQKEVQDGKFYKVNTYMANSREKAGVHSEIESVFMKNDILYIVGQKTAKDGGIWKKIQSDGYINQRIIKPIEPRK